MSQPPLSQQIQALAKEIGAKRLERNTRQVRLTPAGGLMIDLIQAFRGRFPQIQLTLREMTSAQQGQALLDGTIHIGFLRSIECAKPIDYRTFTSESLIAILPEQHPLVSQQILSVSSLKLEPFILPPRHLGVPFHDLIMGFCAQHGVYPNVVQEAIQMYTIVNLVAANFGVSIAPSSVAVFQRSGVGFRPFEESVPSVPLIAAWRTDTDKGALSAFLETMEDISPAATNE